jgi:hypothetical protein
MRIVPIIYWYIVGRFGSLLIGILLLILILVFSAFFFRKNNLRLMVLARAHKIDFKQVISAEGENVAVSWWETTTNQTESATEDVPVMRVRNDGAQTFSPLLRLAANGTISTTATDGEADVE